MHSWCHLAPRTNHIFSVTTKEPKGTRSVPFEAEDLILVPGLAFDRFGGRLGSGKGFYDRFLASLYPRKWGVCFECQVVKEALAQSSNDVRMDGLVTEKGLSIF